MGLWLLVAAVVEDMGGSPPETGGVLLQPGHGPSEARERWEPRDHPAKEIHLQMFVCELLRVKVGL